MNRVPLVRRSPLIFTRKGGEGEKGQIYKIQRLMNVFQRRRRGGVGQGSRFGLARRTKKGGGRVGQTQLKDSSSLLGGGKKKPPGAAICVGWPNAAERKERRGGG